MTHEASTASLHAHWQDRGDTWQDVVAELDRIADHVRECGPTCQLVSDCVISGSLVTIERDPEMPWTSGYEASRFEPARPLLRG